MPISGADFGRRFWAPILDGRVLNSPPQGDSIAVMEESLAGKLLVAMPRIGDPRFDHTVIMMCTHTEEHAMGLVLNRPKDELTLGDVLDHLGISAAPEMAPVTVLDGGPVRPDRGFVLHS